MVISNEEIHGIMKIFKSPEDADLLIKGVCEIIKYKAKKQKGAFVGMLLGTLGASLLGNILTGKGATKGVEVVIRASDEFIKADKRICGVVV